MIEVDAALRRILEAVAPLPPIEIESGEALGRVLADPIAADRDFPATDRSAMDGFAVRSADLPEPERALRVAGEIRAGASAAGLVVRAGEAVRIFTGAPVPSGADAVVMVERTAENAATGAVVVREKPKPGQNIRRCGEDIAAGETILRAGAVIHAAEAAALASVGATRIRVVGSPRVATLSTGDELVVAGQSVATHQIRNSNAPMLAAQIGELGLEARDLGIAVDDAAGLDRAISQGLAGDVLLITGGVSVGAYDLVATALRKAGLELLFHGVAMRPGKPILAGRCGRTLVVGLPGNPLSAFTGFHVIVAPALRKMMGHAIAAPFEVRAILGERIERRLGRTSFALARLAVEDGRLVAHPVRTMSSGDVVSLARSNAFVMAPGSTQAFEAGCEVRVLPWRDFNLRA